MFRKPRDDITPDIGRPPSPLTPLSSISNDNVPINLQPITLSMATKTAPLTPVSNKASPTPRSFQSRAKTTTAKNGSILSFFKKSDQDSSVNADPLFVQDTSPQKLSASRPFYNNSDLPPGLQLTSESNEIYQWEDASRFNEDIASNKRRKMSLSTAEEEASTAEPGVNDAGLGQRACSPPPQPEVNDDRETEDTPTQQTETRENNSRRQTGPFLDDSDSDDGSPFPSVAARKKQSEQDIESLPTDYLDDSAIKEEAITEDTLESEQKPPALTREATSYMEPDGFAEFEGMEDFDDEYIEGDEFMERRWQLEQRKLELAEQGFEGDIDDDDLDAMLDETRPRLEQNETQREGEAEPTDAATCPVCSASFAGVSDQEASVHVNHCLDGNPTPLPTTKSPVKTAVTSKQEPQAATSKLYRPARPAKPGQENPFVLGQPNGASSAFSKLMSSHAEDAAWATAAAAENAARGKPAYQRTCPFYKILPGFNICVDAFRYGAVQGCNAYFLSHFHSDHYIGLTATWSHGPIYCSRPTANLVRRQLRVDPKWLVDLEFESKVEVPGTNGVHVTMIPANHCPGSSLFLFEKVIGRGKNPKVQRVLHCGDFRACPAHVEHPLLKPDVVDSLSGKAAQQKIDVCYLDTTYLNPRYAFPSQEDVIQACADMCVSLDKPQPDAHDNTPQAQTDRADSSIANFVRTESTGAADPSASSGTTTTNSRGRLLVVVGTYSIGKERICLGIARALNSLIYAPPGKQRICASLEDAELNARLTTDPRAAQVHMTPLFEIRAETLADYLTLQGGAFARAVAFRPSGWNYRPPGSRFTESPAVTTVLYADSWRSTFSVKDLVPQRGSGPRCATYGVPYSEHSSFRELTMFCCALRIDKIIPTVNVGSAKSRERMKQWVERWNTYKKKEGLFKVVGQDQEGKGRWYAGKGTWELRTTL